MQKRVKNICKEFWINKLFSLNFFVKSSRYNVQLGDCCKNHWLDSPLHHAVERFDSLTQNVAERFDSPRRDAAERSDSLHEFETKIVELLGYE
jgi:hypothetical protein